MQWILQNLQKLKQHQPKIGTQTRPSEVKTIRNNDKTPTITMNIEKRSWAWLIFDRKKPLDSIMDKIPIICNSNPEIIEIKPMKNRNNNPIIIKITPIITEILK